MHIDKAGGDLDLKNASFHVKCHDYYRMLDVFLLFLIYTIRKTSTIRIKGTIGEDGGM